MPFKPIVFNEGEPLDPQKLTDLNTNIKEAFDNSDNLYSSTVNNITQTLKPVIYANKIEATDLSPNTPKAFNIDLGNGFDSTQPIYITATPRGIVKSNENITITVYRGGSTPQIYVQTNSKERRSLTIDWVAIQLIEAL
jgi:hypothetical protein